MKNIFLIIFISLLSFSTLFFIGNRRLIFAQYAPCKFVSCYASKESAPCPDRTQIENLKVRITEKKDKLMYYKNRAIFEKNDLNANIEKVIQPRIDWYKAKIEESQNVINILPQDSGGLIDFEKLLINIYDEKKEWAEEEKEYKKKLIGKLDELARALGELEDPINKLVALPDKCLENVKNKCSGECKEGCHDFLYCEAKGPCSGGNPCPTDEIQKQVNEVIDKVSPIDKICDEIIEIVDSIPKSRTSKFL